MKYSFKNAFTVLLLFLIFFASIPVYSTSSNNNSYITLNENWQYCIGDLQQDNLKWNDIENILTYMERPKIVIQFG